MKTIRETVAPILKPYDFDGEPVDVLIAALAQLKAKVPAEYVAMIDYDRGYDGDPAELTVYYQRPETAEDVAKREAEVIARREADRESELARARYILAKYGEQK